MIAQPTTTANARQQRATHFIHALERLDPGGQARLRRNAGNTLAEATDAHRTFFQALPYGNERDEPTFFIIATLFALTKPEDRISDNRSLGTTLHFVRHTQGDRANSLDRRFQALIDSDREQLPFRLRQLVRLAKAKGQKIDFARLLLDVLAWQHEARYIQLQWSRDYFIGPHDPASTP